MVNISVKEYKEGDILPKPNGLQDLLILFYSNAWSDFNIVVKAVSDKDDYQWEESGFMYWPWVTDIKESERIPFRSYIHLNSEIRDICTDREKLSCLTIITNQ